MANYLKVCFKTARAYLWVPLAVGAEPEIAAREQLNLWRMPRDPDDANVWIATSVEWGNRGPVAPPSNRYTWELQGIVLAPFGDPESDPTAPDSVTFRRTYCNTLPDEVEGDDVIASGNPLAPMAMSATRAEIGVLPRDWEPNGGKLLAIWSGLPEDFAVDLEPREITKTVTRLPADNGAVWEVTVRYYTDADASWTDAPEREWTASFPVRDPYLLPWRAEENHAYGDSLFPPTDWAGGPALFCSIKDPYTFSVDPENPEDYCTFEIALGIQASETALLPFPLWDWEDQWDRSDHIFSCGQFPPTPGVPLSQYGECFATRTVGPLHTGPVQVWRFLNVGGGIAILVAGCKMPKSEEKVKDVLRRIVQVIVAIVAVFIAALAALRIIAAILAAAELVEAALTAAYALLGRVALQLVALFRRMSILVKIIYSDIELGMKKVLNAALGTLNNTKIIFERGVEFVEEAITAESTETRQLLAEKAAQAARDAANERLKAETAKEVAKQTVRRL